jgi:hypothetical protein
MVQFIPNTPGAIIDYLSTRPGLSSVTFSTSLLGFESGDEWVRLNEAPGSVVVRGRLFATQFDFNVYSGSLERCRAIAGLVHGYMTMMKGYTSDEIVIAEVETDVLPFDLTDLVNAQPRYVFTMTVYCRSN